MKKGKLRVIEGNRLSFWCVGCNEAHCVEIGRWTFNGNYERPTFTPSVLVTSGHYLPAQYKVGDTCWCTYNKAHPEQPAPFICSRCHTYITDGKIQFLADCTHAYAGRTVDLVEFGT